MNGMQQDHQPRAFPGDEADFTGSRIETAPEPAAEANGHTANGQGDDEIPYEERAQFAGVEADDDDELVTTDELIEAPSSAADRGVENSPLTRLSFVGSALGAIALIIWMFSGFFTGGNQQAQESEAESPLPAESASAFGEDDRMRAELALIEQARSRPEQRLAETPQRPTPEDEGEAATEPDTTPPTTPPTQVSRPTPAPTPARPAATPPPEPAASPTIRPSSVAATEEEVDPLERWARLSEAGAAGAEVALVPEPEIEEPTRETEQPTRVNPNINRQNSDSDSEALPFPAATVGDDPVPLPNEGGISNKEAEPVARRNSNAEVRLASSSPGAAGIIQQRPVTPAASEAAEPDQLQQVAIGESAPGTVIVPVVYAGGEVSARGRFAIELTEPLRDINGEVALAAGTVLITQLTEILDANIVRQQVVAIVYRDDQGQVRQEALEPGVLMVRGEDNRPLVAQVRNDDGGSDLGDDVLVGALSALGNIGAVLNAPDAVTTATSEAAGGTSSTSTTTTVTSGQDDDVVAAALEGFFTPVSERVAERFEQQSQNTSSPYLFVPEGQTVSVFVNGVLEVAQ